MTLKNWCWSSVHFWYRRYNFYTKQVGIYIVLFWLADCTDNIARRRGWGREGVMHIDSNQKKCCCCTCFLKFVLWFEFQLMHRWSWIVWFEMNWFHFHHEPSLMRLLIYWLIDNKTNFRFIIQQIQAEHRSETWCKYTFCLNPFKLKNGVVYKIEILLIE